MEVLPVDLDELPVEDAEPFEGSALKRYRLPDASSGIYRVFLQGGAHQDVKADNASHAFQLVGRSDVERIVNVAYAHSHMLDGDALQPTDETVMPDIEPAEEQKIIAEFGEETYGTFDMIGLDGLAELYKQSD